MKDVSEKFANWQRLSGSWLKVIAMVSMLIDHTAGQLLRNVEAFNEPLISLGHHHISWYFLMRSAGRLAFPPNISSMPSTPFISLPSISLRCGSFNNNQGTVISKAQMIRELPLKTLSAL